MTKKQDFDIAYRILCDEMYGIKGYSLNEKIQYGEIPEIVRPDLLQFKIKIDKILLGHTRLIYKKIKLKNI